MGSRDPLIRGAGAQVASSGWRRLLGLMIVCMWCSTHGACAAHPVTPAANPSMQINQISIEHDCFGCASGSRLVLLRGGSAVLTLTGNARHGTVDKVSVATLPAAEFESVARLLIAQGFFDLDEAYENPDVQDGAWTAVSVQRGTQLKRVFWRNDAGPASLRTIAAAFGALQARSRFVDAAR